MLEGFKTKCLSIVLVRFASWKNFAIFISIFWHYFFPKSVNVTVWTMAYALPYRARQLYEMYGILSLQAKDSKHAALKGELSITNRSHSTDKDGKWWQLMRSNYFRSFYLPEHQPSPPSYNSHFKPCKPPHCELPKFCGCGREKGDEDHTHIVWFVVSVPFL